MEATSPSADTTRLAVFSWLWALAVVLHLLYLTNSYAAFASCTADHAVHLALGVAAIALLVRPRSMALLAVVSVLTPVTAWFEAPRLGNHWLLASLVALAILSAMAVGVVRRPRQMERAVACDGLPVARLIFLIVYGFCALAKFNTSFIDPTVSCANLFADEVMQSLGFSGFTSTGSTWWMHVVPWAVMAIETSVVVLLLVARTRVLGVILALVFHGLIALDTEHAFSDFSSVIAALVVLFLPDDLFTSLSARIGSPLIRVGGLVVAAVSAVLLIWQSTDTGFHSVDAIGNSRDALWWTVWIGVTAAIVAWTERTHILRSDLALVPEDRGLMAWPALAFLIGCGPYLGFRTATSWNMYANLRTTPKSSNSFLIPVPAVFGPGDDEFVRIVASSDAGLQQYVGTGLVMPFDNLQDYTSTHPDLSVTYVRGDTTIVVEHSHDDPRLRRELPWWQTRLFAFRSADTNDPVSCQNTMWAAR